MNKNDMGLLPMTAAVLAGGRNSRISVEKSLLNIGRQVLIDNTMRILDSCFSETIIITDKDVLRQRFPDRKIFADIYRDAGALGGLHSALTNAANDAVFIFACDMPNLSRNLISNMGEYYLRNCIEGLLIAAHSRGYEPLHSIYCKSSIEMLASHITEGKLKISNFFEMVETMYYSVPDSLISKFYNINTKEDLLNWYEREMMFKTNCKKIVSE